jgi:heme-degrading monooxygenase HmoA
VIICVIEFGTAPGMEERRRKLVAEMIVEAKTIEGFISKETFSSMDNPSKVITLSYWKDRESLGRWMRNAEHRRAIPQGKKELFTHYTIELAEVVSSKVWNKVWSRVWSEDWSKA